MSSGNLFGEYLEVFLPFCYLKKICKNQCKLLVLRANSVVSQLWWDMGRETHKRCYVAVTSVTDGLHNRGVVLIKFYNLSPFTVYTTLQIYVQPFLYKIYNVWSVCIHKNTVSFYTAFKLHSIRTNTSSLNLDTLVLRYSYSLTLELLHFSSNQYYLTAVGLYH